LGPARLVRVFPRLFFEVFDAFFFGAFFFFVTVVITTALDFLGIA
jgi:hypothetical protein